MKLNRKKTLILGGTRFIGRNLVMRMIHDGDFEITLFNRQQAMEGLFPTVKNIKGDREIADIEQIATEKWDYIVDLSCYYPTALMNTLKMLGKKPDRYIFISTCSVYDNRNDQSVLRDESAGILECTDEQRTHRGPETYGNRKAECERIMRASGIDHVILRPALVFGPYDYTDRLYYWLHQVKTTGEVLFPDHGQRLFSVTYVEDLVETVIRLLHHKPAQTVYNVISEPQTSIGSIIHWAEELLGKKVRKIDAEPGFFKANGIDQWTDMPLWIDGDHFTYSNRALRRFGVNPAAFEQSMEKTVGYYESLNWPSPGFGMTDAVKQKLLKKLKTEN